MYVLRRTLGQLIGEIPVHDKSPANSFLCWDNRRNFQLVAVVPKEKPIDAVKFQSPAYIVRTCLLNCLIASPTEHDSKIHAVEGPERNRRLLPPHRAAMPFATLSCGMWVCNFSAHAQNTP